MPTKSLQLDGPDLEELLARAMNEAGPGGRVASADRVRRGGIAGFFAREHFEVVVEFDDEGAGGGPPAAPARRTRSGGRTRCCSGRGAELDRPDRRDRGRARDLRDVDAALCWCWWSDPAGTTPTARIDVAAARTPALGSEARDALDAEGVVRRHALGHRPRHRDRGRSGCQHGQRRRHHRDRHGGWPPSATATNSTPAIGTTPTTRGGPGDAPRGAGRQSHGRCGNAALADHRRRNPDRCVDRRHRGRRAPAGVGARARRRPLHGRGGTGLRVAGRRRRVNGPTRPGRARPARRAAARAHRAVLPRSAQHVGGRADLRRGRADLGAPGPARRPVAA